MIVNAMDVCKGIAEPGIKLAEKDYIVGGAEVRDGDEDTWLFYTDPHHTFNAGDHLGWVLDSLNRQCKIKPIKGIPPLDREVALMIVEDNPFHTTWAELLDGVENLSRYVPDDKLKSGDMTTAEDESRGYYRTAERALSVIGGNIRRGGKIPDVLLADIELGEGMNGIQLVKELHRRYPDAIIMMMYSSNPGPYVEEIERLKTRGVISGSWHKKDFMPEKFVNAINQELRRRAR